MAMSTHAIKKHTPFAFTMVGRLARPVVLFCLLLVPANGVEGVQRSEWITALPEEADVDSTALAEMFDYIRQHNLPVHSVQIVRGGRLILDAYFYPYNAKMRHDIASVTKSITSTLTGLAIEKKYLRDVKSTCYGFLPRSLDDGARRKKAKK